jgi:predicted enzyme related to lactoylglutathione lyase
MMQGSTAPAVPIHRSGAVRDESAVAPPVQLDGDMSFLADPLVHVELHTGDLSRACAFHAELFGWRAQTVHAGQASYVVLGWGRQLEVGVVGAETDRPLWVPYVEVADIGATTARARRLGASVLVEPSAGPTGWHGIISEPAGGTVGLWQPRP